MRRRALSMVTALAVGVGGAVVSVPAATAAPTAQGAQTATPAHTKPSSPKHRKPGPPKHRKPTRHHVQLGDSYSAGNGAGTYTERTCWRSPDNYGAQVARSMRASYTNVACSGGVVADILSPKTLGEPTEQTATYPLRGRGKSPERQWLRQAKKRQLCGTPEQSDWYYDYDVTSGEAADGSYTATVSCQLTARPQIDSVTPRTDAVYLTIGGNDIGFTDIVAQCLVVRDAAACERTIDDANAAIPQLRKDTTAALRAVHQRSRGQAEVYLLGYPNLVNTDSYSIPEADPTFDAGAELAALQERGDRAQRAGMKELDSRTRGAKGGFTFVDVKPAWGGFEHGLDPSSEPDNSAAWLVPPLAQDRELPEWVHPTSEGHAASAAALRRAMR